MHAKKGKSHWGGQEEGEKEEPLTLLEGKKRKIQQRMNWGLINQKRSRVSGLHFTKRRKSGYKRKLNSLRRDRRDQIKPHKEPTIVTNKDETCEDLRNGSRGVKGSGERVGKETARGGGRRRMRGKEKKTRDPKLREELRIRSFGEGKRGQRAKREQKHNVNLRISGVVGRSKGLPKPGPQSAGEKIGKGDRENTKTTKRGGQSLHILAELGPISSGACRSAAKIEGGQGREGG